MQAPLHDCEAWVSPLVTCSKSQRYSHFNTLPTRLIHLCIEYRHVPVAAINSFASSQTLSKANAILFV